jgi:alpha-ribazole phosphatase
MSLVVWRHPEPAGAVGRCIGCSDPGVDRRRAKRLAHRIRAWARRHGAAREVFSSPLQRGAAVGRWLKRWGWVHRIDPRLAEFDFGDWTGRRWDEIGAAPVDAWCADFAHHAPGGGETLADLLARVGAFTAQAVERAADAHCLVVGHAGWISAATWLAEDRGAPPTATDWPRAVPYAARVELAAAPLALAKSQ